jgi:hypothetical protein
VQERVRDKGESIVESERSRRVAILELFHQEASPPKEEGTSTIGCTGPRTRNPKPRLASHAVCPCRVAAAGRKATLESSLDHPLAFVWSTKGQSRRRQPALGPVPTQHTDTNLPALQMQPFSPKARAIPGNNAGRNAKGSGSLSLPRQMNLTPLSPLTPLTPFAHGRRSSRARWWSG